jgi:hypothetical protein
VTCFRHPLVVVEPGAGGRAALGAGIDCARRARGRLSVVYPFAANPPWWTGIHPMVCAAALPNTRQAEEFLASARDEVPADVPLNIQLLCGRERRRTQVLNAARSFGCDLIIVAPSPGALGSRLGLAALLVRRSYLPVHLVTAPERTRGTVSAVARRAGSSVAGGLTGLAEDLA